MTYAYFTETAFQADERVTSTETSWNTTDVYFLFQLPNSLQAVAQVFMTFETDTWTVVNDLSQSTINVFDFRNFYTAFDLAVQDYVCH